MVIDRSEEIYQQNIKRAQGFLQAHMLQKANQAAGAALTQAVGNGERAVAYQIQGIARRLMGPANFSSALAAFEKAIGFSQSFADRDSKALSGRILRDFGALYHDWAVYIIDEDEKAQLFELANEYFSQSFNLLLEVDDANEAYTTFGFWGTCQFDEGITTPGLTKLRAAHNMLTNIKDYNPVYVINNLIRFSSCSPIDGFKRLPLMLQLTNKSSASHASRKQVYASLLGRKVYLAIRQQAMRNQEN